MPFGHDIAIGDFAPGILARPDLHRLLGLVAHKLHHRAPWQAPDRPGGNGQRPALARHVQHRLFRHRLIALDQRRQLGGPRADQMLHPVDDHLRRIDRARPRRAGIGALAFGELGGAEHILPADIIPVVDMQRQRDDIAAIGKPGQDLIRRRAGRTALRGIKLHHHGTLPLIVRHCQSRHAKPNGQRGTDACLHVQSFRRLLSPCGHIQAEALLPIKVLREISIYAGLRETVHNSIQPRDGALIDAACYGITLTRPRPSFTSEGRSHAHRHRN